MATRQTLQLEELSYEYELFRENQLLTHEQLNKFIRYFEDQDRLTRTCLIGVGLVCGLSAKIKNNVLTISQGCAVTTDGDLLKMETTDYKFFKAYSNLTRGKGDPIYDPFFPPASGGPQVKLWELMVTDKVETGNKPDSLASFKAITGSDVDDMVALLYLEYYLSEPDDCTAIDCDHLGQLQNAKIKALLISQQDMDKVINSEPTEIIADHIYKSYYEAYDKYFVLPELKAKRLPLTSLNTASLGALTKGYTNIIANGTSALVEAIEDLYNTFQFILDPTKYFKILTIKSKLNVTLTSAVKPFQVQYLYDFYKDIIDCYNEIKDTIYNAIYICCPDKYAFPKHIMLGIVNADLGPRPPKYRHYFYPSPAVSKNKSYLSVAKSMFNRLVDMNNGFNLPAQPTAVRVTPSVDPDKQMEWRAIPFYYKNAADLRERWSYYRTMRGTEKNILSYHGVEYGGNDSTKNPLDYDLDKNNFFRIEGHQGKKMNEAMEAIMDIREKKSLPFDIVAVRMDENQKMEIDLNDFTCQFDDLNAVLNAWIVEQDCLYAKTVKFFSSFDNAGKNRQPTKTGGVKFVRETDKKRELSVAPQKEKEAPLLLRSNPAASGKSNISSGYSSGMKSNYTYQQGKTYQVDDTVNQNLFQEEDTIGHTYMELTQANNFMLADAYIGLFLQFADQNPKLQLLTSDQREIVYNIPVKLISRINEVTRFKPFEIQDLNGDVLTDYKNAIEALCDESEASRTKAETIFAKATWVKQGYEPQYLSALVELTENCCAADKLKTLMEEIEERKQAILDSLSFANYSAKHAGLEHRAGVVRGGTFVILYASVVTKGIPGKSPGGASLSAGNDSKSRLVKALQRDITDFYEEDEDTFLLELVSRKEELDVPETIKDYLGVKGYSMSTLKGKVKLSAMLSRADFFAAQLAADLKDTVSNEMVVADFCLPYLCCSDCPPMVFVMPKQKYSLALPKAVACSDETPLLFQKEPTDGKVVASAGFEATIVEKDGQTFFDPAKVNAADFGKEIKFTIDGQVTDCVIKVLKHPTAKFSYKITNENADIMVVQYTNESDDATGTQYEYEWDFADGRPVQKVKTKDPITVTYKKDLFANGAKSFKVTLKANNGGCTHSVEQTVPITTVPVNVDLIPDKTKACTNDAPIGLTVVPANGSVKCKEVPAAMLIKDGKLTFDPSVIPMALREVPMHFTVNDKDVPATITVFTMPDASFSVDNDNAVRKGDLMSFDIFLKNVNADAYMLEYPGGVISKDLKPDGTGMFHVADLDIKGISGKTTLTLKANRKDSPCGIAVATETLIIPEAPVSRCNEVVANFLSNGMAALEAQHSSLKNQALISLNRYYIDEVFKKAIASVDKLSELSVQILLYAAIKERLGNLLGLKLDEATEQRQATLILRQVLMISMNIIRCDDKVEPEIEERHNDIMKAFMDSVLKDSLAKNFSTLDERDILTAFIKKFLEDYQPGGSVADILIEVMKILETNF